MKSRSLLIILIMGIILFSGIVSAVNEESPGNEPIPKETSKLKSPVSPFIFFSIVSILLICLIAFLFIFRKVRLIWLTTLVCGVLGIIIGFLSPWLTQFQFVNLICPSVGGTPQYHTTCVGDFYLSLFGTGFSGGNWHLFAYIPLFMIVWAIIFGIIGAVIGIAIYKIKHKRMKKLAEKSEADFLEACTDVAITYKEF